MPTLYPTLLEGLTFIEASPTLVYTAPVWMAPAAATGAAIGSVGWAGYEVYENWEGLGDAISYYSTAEGWQQTFRYFREEATPNSHSKRLIESIGIPDPLPPPPPEPPTPDVIPLLIVGGTAAAGAGAVQYYNPPIYAPTPAAEPKVFVFPASTRPLEVQQIAEEICEELGLDSNNPSDWEYCLEKAENEYAGQASYLLSDPIHIDSNDPVAMRRGKELRMDYIVQYYRRNMWSTNKDSNEYPTPERLFVALLKLSPQRIEYIAFLFDKIESNKHKFALLKFATGNSRYTYTDYQIHSVLEFLKNNFAKIPDVGSLLADMASNDNPGHCAEIVVADELTKLPNVKLVSINSKIVTNGTPVTDIDIVLDVQTGNLTRRINVSVKLKIDSKRYFLFSEDLKKQKEIAKTNNSGLIVVYCNSFNEKDSHFDPYLQEHRKQSIQYVMFDHLQNLKPEVLVQKSLQIYK